MEFMPFKFIDIHSHLNISPLKEDQDGVLLRMKEKEIATITVGVDYDTSLEALRLAEKNENMWATVGLHPNDNVNEIFDIEKYKNLVMNPKVVAIGECGLDYFRLVESGDERLKTKEKQKELFQQHIELAKISGKPLMIHARPSKGSMDAYEDVIEQLLITNDELQKEGREKIKVNFHFFVGNVDIAKKILELGGTMSYDGPITFTDEYNEVIKYIPLESMHAETDAPFAAPVPYRGKTCEPWMVSEIVKRIAEIKNEPIEKVEMQLVENAKNFFGLK
jgi:TatD DNase family protein